MLHGDPGAPLRLDVLRGDERLQLQVERWAEPNKPDASHEIVRKLADGRVGYADLSYLTPADVPAMFETFADTDAIVVDMRGYPNGTAWTIAPYLDQHPGPTPAASFLQPLVSQGLYGPEHGNNRKRFVQALPERDVDPYTGRTVMLIDDRAISQAEHTGLFFHAANGTTFVGSPTAGANGDVTAVRLPDGLVVMFTGQAVVPLDRAPLQRVGLQPDLPVEPTIAGVRAGKDEVLEAALVWLEEASPSRTR